LKKGRLDAAYFRRKFGVEIFDEFADGFAAIEAEEFLHRKPDGVELTREGLLRVDRLLANFFEPEYRNTRYT
jgi:oxygen-independent coproporphyrinogen-3 oxidase